MFQKQPKPHAWNQQLHIMTFVSQEPTEMRGLLSLAASLNTQFSSIEVLFVLFRFENTLECGGKKSSIIPAKGHHPLTETEINFWRIFWIMGMSRYGETFFPGQNVGSQPGTNKGISSLTLARPEDMRMAKCVRWSQEQVVALLPMWTVRQPRVDQRPCRLPGSYSQKAHLTASSRVSTGFREEEIKDDEDDSPFSVIWGTLQRWQMVLMKSNQVSWVRNFIFDALF